MLTLGGQAVIEGVVVRSPRFVSLALLTPQGDCEIRTTAAPSLLASRRWRRAPFVRGIVALVESLSVGTWALMTSASVARGDGATLTRGKIRVLLARSLTISIVVFFLGPAALARSAGAVVPSPLGQNLLEGALRIALVLGFLVIIARVPEIRRVFQYHGAEHKAVCAYETGLPLDVASVKRASPFHARCGTTFLIMVLLVAVAVFALLGHPPLGIRLAERALLLPVLAAVSYELMRLPQRFPRFRALIIPGLWLQRLTTREPDERQISVALAAVHNVLAQEQEWNDRNGGGPV